MLALGKRHASQGLRMPPIRPWAALAADLRIQGIDALSHGKVPCAADDESIEEVSWPSDTGARLRSTVTSTMTPAEQNRARH